MRTVAVLGGGAGGLATAVDLGLRDIAVRYWARGAARLTAGDPRPVLAATGELVGEVRPQVVTDDLATALTGAEGAVISLPAIAYPSLVAGLAAAARAGATLPPLILNPGHTGGALHVAARLRAATIPVPPIVELSTLAYVARSAAPGTVHVSGRARRLRGAACFDRPETSALASARALFPAIAPERDVMATSLSNVNLVLHPPGALLGAAWVEATGGAYTFYGEGMTEGVARVVRTLDDERRAVAAAFGHDLPPLELEMAAIGTADRPRADAGDLRGAIAGGAANAAIRAPDGLGHRYYREDFAYGVVPFLAFATAAGVPAPLAQAMVSLAGALLGADPRDDGLTAERMGIDGLDAEGVRALVLGAGAYA